MRYQDAEGVWQTRAAGSALPFRERDLAHSSINFKFPVFPGQVQTLYFRVESAGSLQFPLEIGSQEYFFAEAQRSLCGGFVLRSDADDRHLQFHCVVHQS